MPEGIINSHTFSQYFILKLLQITYYQFPPFIVYHYIGDILVADSETDTLEIMFTKVKRVLPFRELKIAPEKRQK